MMNFITRLRVEVWPDIADTLLPTFSGKKDYAVEADNKRVCRAIQHLSYAIDWSTQQSETKISFQSAWGRDIKGWCSETRIASAVCNFFEHRHIVTIQNSVSVITRAVWQFANDWTFETHVGKFLSRTKALFTHSPYHQWVHDVKIAHFVRSHLFSVSKGEIDEAKQKFNTERYTKLFPLFDALLKKDSTKLEKMDTDEPTLQDLLKAVQTSCSESNIDACLKGIYNTLKLKDVDDAEKQFKWHKKLTNALEDLTRQDIEAVGKLRNHPDPEVRAYVEDTLLRIPETVITQAHREFNDANNSAHNDFLLQLPRLIVVFNILRAAEDTKVRETLKNKFTRITPARLRKVCETYQSSMLNTTFKIVTLTVAGFFFFLHHQFFILTGLIGFFISATARRDKNTGLIQGTIQALWESFQNVNSSGKILTVFALLYVAWVSLLIAGFLYAFILGSYVSFSAENRSHATSYTAKQSHSTEELPKLPLWGLSTSGNDERPLSARRQSADNGTPDSRLRRSPVS